VETQKAIKIQIEAFRRSCEATKSIESYMYMYMFDGMEVKEREGEGEKKAKMLFICCRAFE
jgi:hypothetical protein